MTSDVSGFTPHKIQIKTKSCRSLMAIHLQMGLYFFKNVYESGFKIPDHKLKRHIWEIQAPY